MATSDKFIQSMVELLDKLIENQSKNASLLSEIKFSLAELREEQERVLTNLRDKLPDQISREHEEYYSKLTAVISKIETANNRLAENVKYSQEDNVTFKTSIDRNNKNIEEYTAILKAMKEKIEEKDDKKEEFENIIKEIKSVIDAVKSKKAWAAIIVAAITALGTMVAAVVAGFDSINKNIDDKKQSIIQALPQNPPTPAQPNP
jgi:chromosome segregation ATPase